jgi:hypothetical protein
MMRYISKVFLVFMMAMFFPSELVADAANAPYATLKEISTDIRHHTDIKAVVDSLYTQMRPRVLIHDTSIDSATTDQKTRTYIQNRYAPALIANYTHLYDKLTRAHKEFTPCDNPQPINADAPVQQALCTLHLGDTLIVRYLTRMPPDAWKTSAEYRFLQQKNRLTLKAIRLSLPPEAKVRIKGL